MSAAPRTTKRIAEVDMDTASYVGNGEDGVYVSAAKGPKGWYVSTLVDCNTAHFCDSLVTDDGPYASELEATTAGCYGAADWCIENQVRYRRQLQRCLRAAKQAAKRAK